MAQHDSRTFFRYSLDPVRLAVMTALVLSPAELLAESRITPKLTIASYGYQIEQDNIEGTDEGAALNLSPSLSLAVNRKNLQTSLFWQHNAFWYKDEQREQHFSNEYQFNNVLSSAGKGVSWGVNASSSYRTRSSQQSIFADKVTGAQYLSKVSDYGSFLNFQTQRYSLVNAQLRLDYRYSEAEQAVVGDIPAFENQHYSASLLLANRKQNNEAFWSINGNYNKVERDQLRNFESTSTQMSLGAPFSNRFALITRASYETNDNAQFYNNEFYSYGSGLELKFGRASWINASINRSTTRYPLFEDQDDQKHTYMASELHWQPSRRTLFTATVDRRYFGRTFSVNGQYNLKHLTIRLSGNDSVRTLSALDQEIENLGIFVCPDGTSDMGGCFRPPSIDYSLQPGESYQQLITINPELREDLVLQRQGTLAIGYDKNRLSLNLIMNVSRHDYVESERLNRNKSLSLSASWRLTEQSKLLLNSRYYQLDYAFEGRKDNNLSLSMGIDTALSDNSSMTLTARRINRNSNLSSLNASENRLWLSYDYRF